MIPVCVSSVGFEGDHEVYLGMNKGKVGGKDAVKDTQDVQLALP
jgi:hypothetical protein